MPDGYVTMEIKEETTVNVPEHEVLLSFNGDSMAYAFDDWWKAQGHKVFSQFWTTNQIKYIEGTEGKG